MDIAVLSDIHGNFEAFQTCMDYALAREIKTFIFLGDYLGEFAYPQRTMEYLYCLRDAYQCTFIRGNKENYWLNYRRAGEQGWKEYDSTTGSLYYTYHNITEKDLAFFAEMKQAETLQFGNIEPITICHGSPRKVNEKLLPENENTYEIMEQSSTRLILCGHTHIQNKIVYKGKAVLNPGAVGTPFCSNGGAQFLILHQNGSLWEEEFLTLDYNVEKEIANLYAAKLDKIAPYWCRMTVRVLRTGKDSHSTVLDKAMELCRQTEGECIWPNIPEIYWEQAYRLLFGEEDLLGVDCTRNPEEQSFPIRLESREIYECPWLTLYSDKVELSDGFVIDTYHRVHIPNASVCVVVLNEKNEILLIRSKRYTTGRLEWEVPAGKMENGECAESAARRECMEETGCRIKQLEYLCSQNPCNGITDMLIYYYAARVESESSILDKNEVLDKRWVSKEEAAILLQSNGSRCGVSMFALLYAMQFYL